MERTFKRRKKQTILLTGAGGNIGKEALQMLIRRRNLYDVRVFDLPTAKNKEYFDRFFGEIETFYGDITNPQDTIAAVKDADVVIHMASVIPPLARERPDLVDKVNVQGTQNLVTNMERHCPDALLLFASSVAIYGDRLKNPYINVGDPLIPAEGDYYAEGKIKMEKIIEESKLAWSIFRLSAIMGAGNHKLTGLLFLMPLDQMFEITTPRDTARAFVNGIVHREELVGRIFNLGGGPECVTSYREFLSQNFKIFGLGKLDFPHHAFAEKNFHCGIFQDGDDLEDIVHFRRDTLQDYYRMVRESTPRIQYYAARMFAKVAKSYILSKSDPYRAWLENDKEMMEQYFFNGKELAEKREKKEAEEKRTKEVARIEREEALKAKEAKANANRQEKVENEKNVD